MTAPTIVIGEFIVVLMFLVACAPTADPTPLPTLEPLPTYTAAPTQEPLPTLEPLPTFTPFPTPLPPTLTPLATSTFVPPTPIPILVRVLGTTSKLLLRQVGFNVNGFIYNAKGFPVLSEFIYPHNGSVSDRIKYLPGNRIEVEEFGDLVFAKVHGFETNFSKMVIKADGGEKYYVAVERGANGELLYVAAWLVKIP